MTPTLATRCSAPDLGVTWDNGKGQTLMAFGDTFRVRPDRLRRRWKRLALSDPGQNVRHQNLSDGVTLRRHGH